MEPLVEKIKSLAARTNVVGADFVFTQLAVGLTYIQIVKDSLNMTAEHKFVLHSYAYRALMEAEAQMWNWNIKPEELNEVTAQLERLKFELGIVRAL